MMLLVLRLIRGWDRFRDLVITEYFKWSRIKKQNKLFVSTYWASASAVTINGSEKKSQNFLRFQGNNFSTMEHNNT